MSSRSSFTAPSWNEPLDALDARRIEDAATCRTGKQFDIRAGVFIAVDDNGAAGILYTSSFDGQLNLAHVHGSLDLRDLDKHISLPLIFTNPAFAIISTPRPDLSAPARLTFAAACEWAIRRLVPTVTVNAEALSDIERELSDRGISHRLDHPAGARMDEVHVFRLATLWSALGRKDAMGIVGRFNAGRSPLKDDRRAADLRTQATDLQAEDAALAAIRAASGTTAGRAHNYNQGTSDHGLH